MSLFFLRPFACVDDFRFCDIESSPFDGGGGLGLSDEFKEGDKQLLLSSSVEICLALAQLELRLVVLDLERELDGIKVRPDTGIGSQGALDRP